MKRGDPAAALSMPSLSPRSWWRLAAALSLAAMLCGVLLTGVSVWFLSAVALAGLGPAAFTFNFHVPGALVRLFALGRTAAKYGERLTGHRAALLDQVSRRGKLFAALAAAPATRGAGWQFADQDSLSDFIDDVEDIDYARLRVGLPLLSLATGLGLLAVATLVIVPLALVPILATLSASAAAAWWAAPRMGADWRGIRRLNRGAGRQVGASLASAVALRAEGAWAQTLGRGFRRVEAAQARITRLRKRQALVDAVAALVAPLATLAVLSLSWLAGCRGADLLPAVFLAFAWLALGEAAPGPSRILVARLREKAARENIGRWSGTPVQAHRAEPSIRPRALDVLDLPRCAPDGRRLGGLMNLTLQAGRPKVLSGASGSGKTSLLKQIAGWLDQDCGGRVTAGAHALDPRARRALFHFALHDAAVLSDTVRENLFAPAASDADCWRALDAVELGPRMRSAGGLDAWIKQDMLSLGETQRLNLARALLCDRPAIALDEPTEHVDADQAARIMRRLLRCFDDRILIVASHELPDFWSRIGEGSVVQVPLR